MRECVRDVFAIYDNNISPGLLMIIIKIIILYFIQIRHTDDFPPTGTPASTINCYKEPVGHFTHIFFVPGRRPYPARALTAPLTPFDIPTFSSASTVSPSSD